MGVFHTTIFLSLLCTTFSAPQQPEINDQLQLTDPVTEQPVVITSVGPAQSAQSVQPEKPVIEEEPEAKPVNTVKETAVVTEDKENETRRQIAIPQVSFTFRVYKFISEPIMKVVNTPKVSSVLRNIGTCVVNGAMELFSYYLPAPFMPLIASAAGLVIPFEPVVMLKQKMPVTSYRRAFQTAMNSFLGSFDKYKVDDDFDPYMTRRFNRRFINDEKREDKPENLDV